MTVTPPDELAAFPAPLRELVEAELAAGNAVVEVGHSFPAPPAGAFVRLARSVTTRPRSSGHGLVFFDRNGSLYSGEFTDDHRFYFVLEPPHPPRDETVADPLQAPLAPGEVRTSTVDRFVRSMAIDYERWHDGIGYDLTALRDADADERAAIEAVLLERGARDWRDVEALAALDTPAARDALRGAAHGSDGEVRLAVARHAPGVMTDAERGASLAAALATVSPFAGLAAAIDEAAAFHPPEVVEALWRGARDREGGVAVHFAALLLFVYGKAAEPFDMAQRPFLLRFANPPDGAGRAAAFAELRRRVGLAPEPGSTAL